MRFSYTSLSLATAILLLTLSVFSAGKGSLGNLPAIAQTPPTPQETTAQSQRAEADRLFQQGIQQYQRSQFREALQSWQQALDLYRTIGNRQGEASTLGNLANLYDTVGQHQQAIEIYQQVLDLTRDIGDRIGEGRTLINAGIAYRNLRQYPRAIELLEQGLKIIHEIGDPTEEIQGWGNLGHTYLSSGQSSQAIESFEQQLALVQTTGDRESTRETLNTLGDVYSSLGNYAQALKLYQQSLSITQALGDRENESVALNTIGSMYLKLGNYSQALSSFEQALAILHELTETNGTNEFLHAGEGRIFTNIGSIYLAQGNYPQALRYLEQSQTILHEINDQGGEANALGVISGIYLILGDSSKALSYSEQALTLFREMGDRVNEATTLDNLGVIYSDLGFIHSYPEDYSKASTYLEQALTISREIGSRQGEAVILSHLGSLYNRRGNPTQALAYLELSLAIRQEIGDQVEEAAMLNNIGRIYSDLGDGSKSLIYLEQALSILREISDRSGEASSLSYLADAYRSLGQDQRAIEFDQQALAIQQEIGDRRGEVGSLNKLGIAFLQTGRLAEAEQQLSNAAQVFESLRPGLSDTDKVAFFDTQASTYRYWQLALIMQNKTDEALVASERGRARAFVEQLALRLGGQPTDQNLSTSIPTLEQIKRIARNHNATLVEYSIAPTLNSTNNQEELLVWVVKPTGEITFKRVNLQPLGRSLADFVTDSRAAIGVRGSQFVSVRPRPETDAQIATRQTQQLQQLYNLLIRPIAQELPTDPNAPVIFVPQGELFSVPFPALQDQSGHYLIEQHTILTAPSIQLLEKTQQQGAQVRQINLQDVLVVGNPTMPNVSPNVGDAPQQLVALPGAEREARAIAPLLHTQALIGSQATKAAVVQRMSAARIIHLATHGILRSNLQALDSAIALAPDHTGEPEDGLLTAAELAQMRLNADLVVLSACDTGQGRITGDGVIGLSRALITAGVPSVIVSLWSIPDAPTAQLMTEFYQQLAQTHNKAQALRRAMLTTKHDHPDPRDWAAFTLIGEGE